MCVLSTVEPVYYGQLGTRKSVQIIKVYQFYVKKYHLGSYCN